MNNQKIAIVYHSGTGSTARLAEQVAQGIQSNNRQAQLLRIENKDIIDGRFRNVETMEAITSSAAVIFGSPTYMGSVSAQFKAFADASSEFWADQRWAGKLAAGFTIGSNPSGDQLNTIQYFGILANQHGMLWSGIDIPGGIDRRQRNRLGSQSGLVSYTRDGEIEQVDLQLAQYLGGRVARLAA